MYERVIVILGDTAYRDDTRETGQVYAGKFGYTNVKK